MYVKYELTYNLILCYKLGVKNNVCFAKVYLFFVFSVI